MEQQAEQPLPAAATATSSTQKADSVVVNIAIAANATSYGNGGDYRVLDVNARPIGGGGQQDHHVVVDVDRPIVVNVASSYDDPPPRSRTGNAVAVAVEEVKPEGGGGDREEGDNHSTEICCVVCKKPAKWVAIGRCGHRVVCSTCMVRTRFFQRNKNCCICRTPCPKVLVTKADGAATALSILPRFAFRDGRVGNYWYHGYTRAYFDEEKEYQAARAACEGIIEPWYHPPVFVVLFFVTFLAIGATFGYVVSTGQKGWSQARAYIICISVALLFASGLWFPGACRPEETEVLEARRIRRIKKLKDRGFRLGSG